jgi:hypothetical protein
LVSSNELLYWSWHVVLLSRKSKSACHWNNEESDWLMNPLPLASATGKLRASIFSSPTKHVNESQFSLTGRPRLPDPSMRPTSTWVTCVTGRYWYSVVTHDRSGPSATQSCWATLSPHTALTLSGRNTALSSKSMAIMITIGKEMITQHDRQLRHW